ncbi:MAG TPA: thiamine phosphate synthase [Caulobacteraceae bacterium]|nr:thiamine phosphate synthase [Caulobacteraceae bacterium]
MAEASIQALAQVAARLGRAAPQRQPRGRACPALWFFTDPQRTADPAWTLERLPAGAAVVFRAFGEPRAFVLGQRLRRIAARRRLIFLVGQDARLAARLRADGVHLPERSMASARALRSMHPRWRISVAVHGPRALVAAASLPLDAVVLSAVFASDSPSARAPIGPLRFAVLARRARLPVVALGGIDVQRARRLIGAGAAGVAAVSALARPRT